MCCLTCAYFDATEPPEHKTAREAGQCQQNCSKDWDWRAAFLFVQRHTEPLHGFCRFNPDAKAVASWSYCAQHRPVLDPSDNGWGITQFDRRARSLKEWANQQYLNIKNPKESWSAQRAVYFEEQNKQLRKQLAVARKRSASRLAKLQKAKAKSPQPEKTPAAPLPPSLRLVAAE